MIIDSCRNAREERYTFKEDNTVKNCCLLSKKGSALKEKNLIQNGAVFPFRVDPFSEKGLEVCRVAIHNSRPPLLKNSEKIYQVGPAQLTHWSMQTNTDVLANSADPGETTARCFIRIYLFCHFVIDVWLKPYSQQWMLSNSKRKQSISETHGWKG